jgi:hypothetical protein
MNAKLVWARWLDDFNFLEERLNQKMPFSLGAVRRRCSRARLAEAEPDSAGKSWG